MNALVIRPRVSELVFQVYGRPFHPELFEILASRKVQHEDYEVEVWITRAGHLVCWQNADVLLTEVAHIDQSLPERRRLMHFRMRGEHTHSFRCGADITYQTSFQVEMMAPEVFLHVHDEIRADGERKGMLYDFCPHHRLAVSPLGYLNVEAKPGCLFIQAFHTYPEENTVIKSQTLIERARASRDR